MPWSRTRLQGEKFKLDLLLSADACICPLHDLKSTCHMYISRWSRPSRYITRLNKHILPLVHVMAGCQRPKPALWKPARLQMSRLNLTISRRFKRR